MQQLLDTLYKIAGLLLGDPRSRTAKLLIIAGIPLVAAPWWQPYLQAVSIKYLDLPAATFAEADRAMSASGWSLIAIGVALHVYATYGTSSVFATSGGLSFIEGKFTVVCDTRTANGEIVTVDYFSEMHKYPQYDDCTRFRIEIEGKFFNDTETPRTLQNPIVEFWGVEGVRLISKNPPFFIFDAAQKLWELNDPSRTLPVVARGMTRVRFEFTLGANYADASEMIEDIYGETVALLKAKVLNDREHKFRICTFSFCGSEKVIWPLDRRYPIYNLQKLNSFGRKAGHRPQERRRSKSTIS